MSVNYDVNKVTVESITVSKLNDSFSINVPYVWKDSDGNVVRNGINKYSTQDLISSIPEEVLQPIINTFESVLVENCTKRYVNFNLRKENITATSVGFNNQNERVIVRINTDELSNKFQTAGSSIEVFKTIINGFTQKIFEND